MYFPFPTNKKMSTERAKNERPVIIIMTYSWTPFPKELACSCCKWPSSSVVFDKSRYLFDMPHLCNQVGGWKRQIIWLIWVSMHGKELFGKCTWFSAEIVVNAHVLGWFKIANYIGFLGAYIFWILRIKLVTARGRYNHFS